VGKTSLMNQYVNKKFSNQYKVGTHLETRVFGSFHSVRVALSLLDPL